MNSRLDCNRFRAAFGIALPGYEEALPRVFDASLAAA